MSKTAHVILVVALITYSVTMTVVAFRYEYWNDRMSTVLDTCIGIRTGKQ